MSGWWLSGQELNERISFLFPLQDGEVIRFRQRLSVFAFLVLMAAPSIVSGEPMVIDLGTLPDLNPGICRSWAWQHPGGRTDSCPSCLARLRRETASMSNEPLKANDDT
jgi:hypothetical protein